MVICEDTSPVRNGEKRKSQTYCWGWGADWTLLPQQSLSRSQGCQKRKPRRAKSWTRNNTISQARTITRAARTSKGAKEGIIITTSVQFQMGEKL